MLGLLALSGLSGTDVPLAQACPIIWASFPYKAVFGTNEATVCSRLVSGLYQNGFALRNDTGGLENLGAILSRASGLQPAELKEIQDNYETLEGVIADLRSKGYSFYKGSRAPSPAPVAPVVLTPTIIRPAPDIRTPPIASPSRTVVITQRAPVPAPSLFDSFLTSMRNVTGELVQIKTRKNMQRPMQAAALQTDQRFPASVRSSNTIAYIAIGSFLALGIGAYLLLRKR